MIDAYLDESGIHDGAPICVVAGYFGGRGQWKKFEVDWRSALSDAELPLEKFHAKNLIKRQGIFADWSDAKHATFLIRLADAISRYKIHPVSFSIIVADFNQLSVNERRYFTGASIRQRERDLKFTTSGCPNKPYFMPFQYCLRNICSYAPVGGKAHFYFGLDRSFYDYAFKLFKFIKEETAMQYRDRLGEPSAPLAKNTPQLQAADYLAYLSYLHGQERMKTRDWKSFLNPTLNAIVQRFRSRDDFALFDAECLRGMLKDITIPAER